jgi:sulfide:quinone oxidoreductase
MSELALKHNVIIVGGGAAGIAVASSLVRKDPSLDIAIVEPSDKHYYQPAFTLIGGGAFKPEKTVREESKLIPGGVKWIQHAVTHFDPDINQLKLSDGASVEYKYLIVCPGLQLDWHKIEGLEDTIGKNGVCSNYLKQYAEYTWQCIKNFNGGRAIFTQPAMPVKCAGAPQKIMYLASDYFRKNKILDASDVQFYLQGAAMFSVPTFAKPLEKVAARYGIDVNFSHNLVSIDGDKKEAVFEVVDGENAGNKVTTTFDMIHVTPPQSAPDFIKESPLADEAGWVDVDHHTLQHKRYNNIFSLGDVASSPNSKTAAAVRLQSPVVVQNLLALMKNKSLDKVYDGYSSCPLVTSYHSVILAEFCYEGKVTPTLPLDPTKERYSMWLMKQKFLPILYWDWMLKGHEGDIRHKERPHLLPKE